MEEAVEAEEKKVVEVVVVRRRGEGGARERETNERTRN